MCSWIDHYAIAVYHHDQSSVHRFGDADPRLPRKCALAVFQNPPPTVSRFKGTITMLGWSVAGIASATAAFLFLNRDDKKLALGVGPEGVNTIRGAKHRVGKTEVKSGSQADYQQVYNAIAGLLDKV